jgi:hypothetical protein
LKEVEGFLVLSFDDIHTVLRQQNLTLGMELQHFVA